LHDRQDETPLYLDMPPDEALARFLQTNMGELRELIARKKAAKPKLGGEPQETAKPKTWLSCLARRRPPPVMADRLNTAEAKAIVCCHRHSKALPHAPILSVRA
jgi:hypothetical protein